MIWTSILSFNSSVWLHLTLYISWEQSNIPQHSTILACWDTLPLQGQKDEPRPKKKNPNSPRFSLLLCGWQSFIFLGGAESRGGIVKQAPFIPKLQLGGLELESIKGERIFCFAEGVRGWWEGFWGVPGFAPPLSQSISHSCLWSPDQATLRGNSGSENWQGRLGWCDLGTAQEKLLAYFPSLSQPREAASAHSSSRRKPGASFLSLNFKPGHL